MDSQPYQAVRLDEVRSAGETEPDEAAWKPIRG